MNGGFWRGVVIGGVIAAVVSTIKNSQSRSAVSLFDMSKLRQQSPRRASERVIKDVSRRVSGLIKKR